MLGAPREAKIRPQTPHIAPADPDSTRKIWAMQVQQVEYLVEAEHAHLLAPFTASRTL